MPVRMSGEVIGIIGLVGTSREQKNRILESEKLYMEFLGQIAEFISAKAQEYVSQENKAALLDALNAAMDCITQGLIILGKDKTVTAANETARQQLKIPQPEGMRVIVEATGDHLNSNNEYILTIGERQYEFGRAHV